MSAIIHHRIYPLAILLMVAIMLLGACSAASAPKSERDEYSVEQEGGALPEMPAAEAPVEVAPEPAYDSSGVAPSVANQVGVERVVIKNGSITLVVADPAESMAAISAMAEEMGGFVVSANLYQEFARNGIEVPRAAVTVRVPAERMDEAMDRIRAESGKEPSTENVTSQDVTSEYVDLESRLKNLQAAEAELTQIMEDANRTEDVLAVYQQLVQIREQIEVIQGQINYYDQASALSSIAVDLIADAAEQPIEIAGWQPQGVAKEAVESLASAMQSIANAVIWFVIYLLPVLLVLFVIFVLPPILIIRWLLRRRQSRKTTAATAPPAE